MWNFIPKLWIPLHLLVVLSNMALVEMMLPYLKVSRVKKIVKI